jgi:hypothetical protein
MLMGGVAAWTQVHQSRNRRDLISYEAQETLSKSLIAPSRKSTFSAPSYDHDRKTRRAVGQPYHFPSFQVSTVKSAKCVQNLPTLHIKNRLTLLVLDYATSPASS